MKDDITRALSEMAQERGLMNLTLADLCEEVGISPGGFYKIMGQNFTKTINEMRESGGYPLGNPSKRSRMDVPGLRSAHILDCALNLAAESGVDSLTRDKVAQAAGVSGPLVARYFSMDDLRDSVFTLAVIRRVLPVIAQGMAIQHKAVAGVDLALKSAVIEYLVKQG